MAQPVRTFYPEFTDYSKNHKKFEAWADIQYA